jgi:hypothetical protein
LNESQLIDELNAALDDAAAAVRAPARAAQRARKKARARQLRRGLAAGVPAVGLAAGLAVAVIGPQGPAGLAAPRAQATTRTHQPSVLTVAYVTSRAKSALSQASGWILESRGHGYIQWQDTATAASREETFGPGGKVTSDEAWVFSGSSEHRTYVDYTKGTWWRLTSQVPAQCPAARPPAR